jgi:hypothetical protein
VSGLIDYNFECFKNAIAQVFDVGKKSAKGGSHSTKSSALSSSQHPQQQQKQNNTNVNQTNKS